MKKMTLLTKQMFSIMALLLFSNVSIAQTASALDFDGTNDYVQIGNIMPTTYTKEAWIYISNLSLMNNFISGGDTDGQHAFWAPTAYGNKLSAGHNATWNAVQDPTALAVNTWYHVAVTYDASTTTMKLYKNGALVASNNNVPVFTGGTALRLGTFNANSNLLGGKMDEVRVWNRVLPQCEIQNNMNGELPAGQTGLVVYYKFNQGVASGNNAGTTTLTDSSGNANNGTLTNFALTGTTSNWVTPGGVTTGTMSPAPLSVTSPQVFCNSATVANLTATGSNIKWYNVATGGTALASSASVTSGTYYVSQTVGTCESLRKTVTVTINTTPAPTATSPQNYNSGDKVSNLVASGTALKWYNVATGGTALASTTALTAGTYYVSQTLNSCESASRTTVVVNINGAGLDFDGVDDYVSCGNILSTSYTKEAMIYGYSFPLFVGNIVSGGGTDGLHALFTPGGILSAGHNNTWNYVEDATPLSINTWYHVAVTYDASTTTMKLYKNGALVATNNNVPAYTGGNKVRIGAFDDNSYLFHGVIDEVRVWNRVLAQAEIQNNMNCELGSGQTGLLAYYKFNQGVAFTSNTGLTSLTDSSGNNRTGTLTNFALTGTTSNWVATGGVTTGTTCTTLATTDFEVTSIANIYPNPSSDVFYVESQSNGTATVYDLMGKMVFSQKITSGISKINLNQASKGVYLLQIIDGKGQSKSMKLVKE